MSEMMLMVKFSDLVDICVDPGPKFWWKCNHPKTHSTICIVHQQCSSEAESVSAATKHLIDKHDVRPLFWIPLEDSNAV